jgi:hypothetical protein
MELATAISLWILMALLLAAGLAGLLAKPKPLLIIGALLAGGVFSWQSISFLKSARWCERMMAAHRLIDFDVDGTGDRNLRIHALAEFEGLAVRLIRRDGREFDFASTEACRWRARDSAGPLEIKDEAPHGMPEGLRIPSRGLIDVESRDGFGQGDRTWIDLTYRIDDTTRPLLREHRLVVMAPRFLRMWGEMALSIHTGLAIAFAAAALASWAGVVVQLVRRALRRSVIPNRSLSV